MIFQKWTKYWPTKVICARAAWLLPNRSGRRRITRLRHTLPLTDAKSEIMGALPGHQEAKTTTTTHSKSMPFVAAAMTEQPARQRLVWAVKARLLGWKRMKYAMKSACGCALWPRWIVTSAASPGACLTSTRSGRVLLVRTIELIRRTRQETAAITKKTFLPHPPRSTVRPAAAQIQNVWIRCQGHVSRGRSAKYMPSACHSGSRCAGIRGCAQDARVQNAILTV